MDLKQIRPREQARSLFEEFKGFAFKGNVIDLAVGVIVGTAFGKIVSSLVDNVIMPVVAVILPGRVAYEQWKLTINGKDIPYGKFLGDVVNFLIVAAALFLFAVKFLGWIARVKKQGPPPMTRDQELLTEIRDLLKPPAPGSGS